MANLATQQERKAATQEAAEMSLSGTAASQQDVRSTIVSR
jgi:hypothetical protein